jgi:hypothetical protein
MAVNSFLIKGWGVTLVAALFALAANKANPDFVLIAYFPVIMFWLLDGYFLWQERLFRNLYDHVRSLSEDAIDFSLNTESVGPHAHSWAGACLSLTLVIFYGALIVGILIVMFAIF